MTDWVVTDTAVRLAQITARLTVLRDQMDELMARADRAATVGESPPAPQPRAGDTEQVAHLKAALMAVEDELAGLHTAMETRAVIEQAKGMLMLHRRCDADAAFNVLVELSQTSHRKLHDVAETMVSTWSAVDRASS